MTYAYKDLKTDKWYTMSGEVSENNKKYTAKTTRAIDSAFVGYLTQEDAKNYKKVSASLELVNGKRKVTLL